VCVRTVNTWGGETRDTHTHTHEEGGHVGIVLGLEYVTLIIYGGGARDA